MNIYTLVHSKLHIESCLNKLEQSPSVLSIPTSPALSHEKEDIWI